MIDQPPAHGGQLSALARIYNLDPSTLLDFSANINPDGPPAVVLEALRASLENVSTLAHYPDLHQIQLKEAIAQQIRVEQAAISVANGFVPLLEAVLRALPIRSCLLPMPCFNEYLPALDRAKIQVVSSILPSEFNFSYNVESLLSHDCDAILIANPQNPSGILARLEDILHIVQSAVLRDKYILLDEAFIDYVPEHSLARHVHQLPRLIVFRSVTKFYAIPGMRVAYCIAPAPIAKAIDQNLPPWPISNLASIAVQAASGDKDYADRARSRNGIRRAKLLDGLSFLELRPHPGAANFLLFQLPAHIHPMAFWQAMIRNHNVVLRSCENYAHLASGYLRTAVRGDLDNQFLLQALSDQLKEIEFSR